MDKWERLKLWLKLKAPTGAFNFSPGGVVTPSYFPASTRDRTTTRRPEG